MKRVGLHVGHPRIESLARGQARVVVVISIALGSAVLSLSAGCFAERTIQADLAAVRAVSPPGGAAAAASAREWLAACGPQLSSLLPRHHRPPLTESELVGPDGRLIDVFVHFRTDPKARSSLLKNFLGLMHTAQCAHGSDTHIDLPPWDGFEDVWIPVADGVRLFGRLGLATRGDRPIAADCIVVLPGLFGTLEVERTRAIVAALRDSGRHALAIELRGYGRTAEVQPQVSSTFGVLETGDLLALAEWLQARPEVERTGLIGFCWGANLALLAAWEDGRSAADRNVSPRLAPLLRPLSESRHYEAGVLAISPVVGFEDLLEACEAPTPRLRDPVLHALQKRIREQKQLAGYAPADGSLMALIEAEFARSPLRYSGAVADGLRYLQLRPGATPDTANKLECARIPVLIVHAANDPTASVQATAELGAQVCNPNVAVILLEGGGHVGFAAYARDWFYSLLLNFFGAVSARTDEPDRAPAPVSLR